MDESLCSLSVPLITAIVYGGMYVLKQLVTDNEKLKRLIPSFAIIFGAILGVVAYYTNYNVIPASDPLTALLIGGVSGLAATGSHQLFKQLKSGEDEENNNKK